MLSLSLSHLGYLYGAANTYLLAAAAAAATLLAPVGMFERIGRTVYIAVS